MERLLQTGKVKAIGVANYSVRFLQELLPHVAVMPAVNQIENHPYLPQQGIVDFCREKGIHITAYSPLGSSGSPLLQDERVGEVARKHGVPASAVLLSYHSSTVTAIAVAIANLSYAVTRGSSVLAKSVTPSRIDENRRLVKLDGSDMAALEKIHVEKGVKRFVNLDFGVDFGFPDKQ